jgi:glycosyltransferase involved in cell wall biosynthesis
MMYDLGVRRQVKQIHQEFPFDLIHAHFSYPDGVIAARLGQRYRVPVIITEHAPWQPWMEEYPQVRRQAVWASDRCTFHIPVSHYVRNTIIQYTGESEKLRVIPVGVDCSVFAPPPDGHEPDLNQILYVGQINFTKGIDVLLQAMCQLIAQRPRVRLVLVGGSFYRLKRLQEERLRSLAKELGLENHVEFVGEKSHQEVAELMRRSALLVLPSRAESFGAVLVEAIACGTPVVATQCGGPEDIVNDKVGVLVPKEDVDALASGMLHVLTHRDHYSSALLRSYALENFSWERIACQTVNLYHAALERDRQCRGLQESEVAQTLQV